MRVWTAVLLVLFAAACSRHDPVSADDRRQCAADDPDTVIASCTKLIDSGSASASELATALQNRGRANETRRAFDQAVADFDEAIRVATNSGAAFSARGYAFYVQGDNGARTCLRPVVFCKASARQIGSLPARRE